MKNAQNYMIEYSNILTNKEMTDDVELWNTPWVVRSEQKIYATELERERINEAIQAKKERDMIRYEDRF